MEWCGGCITYWDLQYIDENTSVAKQLNLLKEDLAQIEYPNSIVVDVGWYPEFSLSGSFVVVVIKGFDWDAPLYKKQAFDIKGLKITLTEAVQMVDSLLS